MRKPRRRSVFPFALLSVTTGTPAAGCSSGWSLDMPGELENDDLVMMLVESALERPPEERDNFLQPLCSATPGLYEEVRKRIDWEDRMGGFLREPLLARPE